MDVINLRISRKRYTKIQSVATRCFKYFGTRNPLLVLEEMEIPYSFINLEGDLKGFTNINKNRKHWVYINNKYDDYSVKIIAAHELGHIILHRFDEINMLDEYCAHSKSEYEANIFAIEFMPQIKALDLICEELSDIELQNYICSKLKQLK